MTAATAPSTHASFIDTITYSTLKPTSIPWLWPQRIAAQRLTLLAADPGVGKTALALDLAARLSRGNPMPPQSPLISSGPMDSRHTAPSKKEKNSPTNFTNSTNSTNSTNLTNCTNPLPRHTLLLSPEDHPTDTLLPRLQSAGADLNYIHSLTLAQDSSEDLPLPEALSQALQNLPPISLIIIDPIHAYLPLNASTAQLRALAAIAESHNLAILLTTRLTKRLPTGANDHLSLRRALGSLSFAAACRSFHLLVPDSKNKNRRLLVSLKSNALTLPPTLAFTFPPNDSALSTQDSALVWDSSPLPADHPLAPSPRDLMLRQAAQFLQTILADGPVRAAKLQKAAEQNGITPGTLHRAKTLLDVECKSTGLQGRWFWHLPGDTRPIPRDPFEGLMPTPLDFDPEKFLANLGG